MNMSDWVVQGLVWSLRREKSKSGSLTSVEGPQRDELDLDDGRDDTNPTLARGED